MSCVEREGGPHWPSGPQPCLQQLSAATAAAGYIVAVARAALPQPSASLVACACCRAEPRQGLQQAQQDQDQQNSTYCDLHKHHHASYVVYFTG